MILPTNFTPFLSTNVFLLLLSFIIFDCPYHTALFTNFCLPTIAAFFMMVKTVFIQIIFPTIITFFEIVCCVAKQGRSLPMRPHSLQRDLHLKSCSFDFLNFFSQVKQYLWFTPNIPPTFLNPSKWLFE